jgi:hypothetical protein
VEREDEKVSVKIRLAGAWAELIVLYIYADFLSLYRPGQIEEVARGVMGPFDVSQATLLIASLIVIIPALMIVLSLLVSTGINRSVNLVLAVLYTLINVSNVIGETWAYYLLFGVAEVAVTLLIFFMAWRWRPQGGTRSAVGT